MSAKNTKKSKTEPDPAKPLKNKKHEAFALICTDREKSQSDAYREVYPRSVKWNDKSVHEAASKLYAKVKPRVEFLQAEIDEQNISDKIMGRKEFEERLTDMLRTTHADIVEKDGKGGYRLKEGALTKQALHSLDIVRTVSTGSKGTVTTTEAMKPKTENLKGLYEIYAKVKGFNAADVVDIPGLASLAEQLAKIDGSETAMPDGQVKMGGRG